MAAAHSQLQLRRVASKSLRTACADGSGVLGHEDQVAWGIRRKAEHTILE